MILKITKIVRFSNLKKNPIFWTSIFRIFFVHSKYQVQKTKFVLSIYLNVLYVIHFVLLPWKTLENICNPPSRCLAFTNSITYLLLKLELDPVTYKFLRYKHPLSILSKYQYLNLLVKYECHMVKP